MSSLIQTLTFIVLSLALLFSFTCANTVTVDVSATGEMNALACIGDSVELFIAEINDITKLGHPKDSYIANLYYAVTIANAIVPDLFANIRAQNETLFDNLDAFLNDIFVCTKGPAEEFVQMVLASPGNAVTASRLISFFETHLPSIGECARNSTHLTKFVSVSSFDKISYMTRTLIQMFMDSDEFAKLKSMPPAPVPIQMVVPYFDYFRAAENVPFSFFALTFAKVKRAEFMSKLPAAMLEAENVMVVAQKLKASIDAGKKSECAKNAIELAEVLKEEVYTKFISICDAIKS